MWQDGFQMVFNCEPYLGTILYFGCFDDHLFIAVAAWMIDKDNGEWLEPEGQSLVVKIKQAEN